MVVEHALVDGADHRQTCAYQTFDNGIATVNTETCAALGLDLDTVKQAFKPSTAPPIEADHHRRRASESISSHNDNPSDSGRPVPPGDRHVYRHLI